MTDYAPLTLEKFYRRLIANQIILKRSDIETILRNVENEFPNESEIVRFQKAYERAEEMYKTTALERPAPAHKDISPKAEQFYKELLANKIILRKADIEGIIKEVEVELPGEPEDVQRTKAYEKVKILYDKVHPLRQAKAAYAGPWNGVDQRKTTA